jgi:hypothetical protein
MEKIKRYLKIAVFISPLLLFLGCEKETPCTSVEQGDFELVP